MNEEDFKTEIVCLLNNKIQYEEDESEGLNNYWEIAQDIINLMKNENESPRKKILIFNNITSKPMTFIWKENQKKKYETTLKALQKAERENKVKILYNGDCEKGDETYFNQLNQEVKQ